MEFKGKGVVEGIGIGRIMILRDSFEEELKTYQKGDSEQEKQKLNQAIAIAEKQLSEILIKAKKEDEREQADIMEAHMLMLKDPMFYDGTLQQIEADICAPTAIINVAKELSDMLGALDDPYLRERAVDVKDISKRVLKIILGIEENVFEQDNIILYGKEIEPSVVANLPQEKIAGIVMGNGSTTSHAVIIAKSKNIVTVVGVGEEIGDYSKEDVAIIDGYNGSLILKPDKDSIDKYNKQLKEEEKKKAYYMSLNEIPAITKDNREIILAANIGNPEDIDEALKYGCKGVGLFRTEFIFMGKKRLPTEEEQFEAYKYVVQKLKDELCVIRTLDIGGDKPLSYLEIGKEENPFLGFRAIRISLERTDIFITQIRAILRASAYGRVAIMLPMIISLEEINKAKEIIEEAKKQLDNEGVKYGENIQLGIMVETPAAAIMADVFAKEVDFFSIGTNDLVQYTLAVDRGNQKISKLYSHFDIAILRLVKKVSEAAHENGKWVGICGEMAGDPIMTRLLVGMGIDELSMSAPSIPKIKEQIIESKAEKQFVESIMSYNQASKIKELLTGTIVASNINDIN